MVGLTLADGIEREREEMMTESPSWPRKTLHHLCMNAVGTEMTSKINIAPFRSPLAATRQCQHWPWMGLLWSKLVESCNTNSIPGCLLVHPSAASYQNHHPSSHSHSSGILLVQDPSPPLVQFSWCCLLQNASAMKRRVKERMPAPSPSLTQLAVVKSVLREWGSLEKWREKYWLAKR